MKITLKEEAINLRKGGASYSEILKKVPVAKSTLSLWLRSVGLSKESKQRLTDKKIAAIQRGAMARHQQRLNLLKKIHEETKKDVGNLNNHNLWLSGVMLYWAEGTKEKEHAVGTGVAFNNSDPRMIKLFLKWLKECIGIPDESIKFEIYLHATTNPEKALDFWSKIVNCNKNKIRVYFKKHNIKKTNRKNVGDSYNGLLRVGVRKSSILNRKISAWVNHICGYWKIN